MRALACGFRCYELDQPPSPESFRKQYLPHRQPSARIAKVSLRDIDVTLPQRGANRPTAMTKLPANDGGEGTKSAASRQGAAHKAVKEKISAAAATARLQETKSTGKAPHKLGVMDLFQQRLSTSGLPIAPQFLSATRRAALETPTVPATDAPTTATEARPDAVRDMPVGAGQGAIRGIIAADSLIFLEFAHPRSEASAHRGDPDLARNVGSGHVATAPSPTDHRDAPTTVAPTALQHGGNWLSRWWLAPLIGAAIVASLFVFDYRALLENRIAPIAGTAPRTATVRSARDTTEIRPSFRLPDGQQIEVRGDGPIAGLLAYLANRAAPLGQSFLLDEMTFEQDTSDLSAKSAEQIRQIAQIMHAYPNALVRIEGMSTRRTTRSMPASLPPNALLR